MEFQYHIIPLLIRISYFNNHHCSKPPKSFPASMKWEVPGQGSLIKHQNKLLLSCIVAEGQQRVDQCLPILLNMYLITLKVQKYIFLFIFIFTAQIMKKKKEAVIEKKPKGLYLYGMRLIKNTVDVSEGVRNHIHEKAGFSYYLCSNAKKPPLNHLTVPSSQIHIMWFLFQKR